VYTEKPMATDVPTATRVIKAARKAGKKLVAAPTVLLGQGPVHVKHLLEKGLIGKPAFCRAHGSHGGAGAHGHIYDPSWYYKAEEGGGPLYDVTVYTLHTLTGILGPVKRVTALAGCSQPERPVAYTDDDGLWREKTEKYTGPDNVQLLLGWGDATFGTVDGTHCMVASRGPRMEFYGSDGALNVYGRRESPIEVYTQRDDLGVRGWLSPEAPRGLGGLPAWGLADGVLHLAECILTDAEPVPSGEHARHVIELIVAAGRAAETGKTQTLRTTF
jgi:predicted dehydrogenase